MTVSEIQLSVTGMTCANCAANIERGLRKLGGIKDVSVNFASETASVSFEETAVSLDDIYARIKKSGFGVIVPDHSENADDTADAVRDADIKRQTIQFIVGLVFSIPLFILSMGRDMGGVTSLAFHPAMNWIFFLIATPVQFYFRRGFFIGVFLF